MDQRLEFVVDHQRDLYDMTTLRARYGVSWKTGYKWLARYAAEGAHGLAERSHEPHRCPHRIGHELAALLVAARRASRVFVGRCRYHKSATVSAKAP